MTTRTWYLTCTNVQRCHTCPTPWHQVLQTSTSENIYGKYTEINLCPYIWLSLCCFHETHNYSVNICVVISCTEFYLNSMRNAQNTGKVSFTTFHQLDIMWQSSASCVTKSINQYGKCDLHPHPSMTETGLPFKELIMVVPFCEDLLHCIS